MLKINPELINKSWRKFAKAKNVKNELRIINKKLKNEIYSPLDKDVFRFLNLNLNKVKYVVIGMDPYPGVYKDKNGENIPIATGRAFEPADYKSWLDKTRNTSITNILKAIYVHETNKNISLDNIRKKISDGNFFILPPRDLFDYLEKQGILFINYALTVRQGNTKNNAGSHINIWSNFSSMLIDYIDSNYDVTWILLGSHAQKLKEYINKGKIIEDEHPRTHKFYKNNKCLKLIKDIDYTGKGAK